MWYHDISDVFLELAKSSKYAGKWIVWNLVLSKKPYISISYNIWAKIPETTKLT